MRLEVLHVPDCPLVDGLLASLRAVTSEPVVLREIADESAAIAYGMTGSPTLLVDGVDPFAAPDLVPAMSCRLYRGELDDLRSVLTPRLNKAEGAAALSAAGRRAHAAILGWFVAHGRPPTRAELEQVIGSSGDDPAVAAAELEARDVVAFDDRGEIRAAYPFSPTPTEHRVSVDGRTLYAMCAIDALGTSAMLKRPVAISASEPDSGAWIEVNVDGDRAEWNPLTAVVFAGSTAGDACCQSSVDTTCGTISFFSTSEAAEAWAARHPGVTGSVLTQDEALACGVAEFGSLLRS